MAQSKREGQAPDGAAGNQKGARAAKRFEEAKEKGQEVPSMSNILVRSLSQNVSAKPTSPSTAVPHADSEKNEGAHGHSAIDGPHTDENEANNTISSRWAS
ncbi:g2845 [Coccomyxa elongata]